MLCTHALDDTLFNSHHISMGQADYGYFRCMNKKTKAQMSHLENVKPGEVDSNPGSQALQPTISTQHNTQEFRDDRAVGAQVIPGLPSSTWSKVSLPSDHGTWTCLQEQAECSHHL